jgi:hypothetical protein
VHVPTHVPRFAKRRKCETSAGAQKAKVLIFDSDPLPAGLYVLTCNELAATRAHHAPGLGGLKSACMQGDCGAGCGAVRLQPTGYVYVVLVLRAEERDRSGSETLAAVWLLLVCGGFCFALGWLVGVW